MVSFTHITRYTRTINGQEVMNEVSETLTVPTSVDELVKLDAGDMVEISVGSGKESKTLTVPQLIRDYISGRKLRSNQEMQAEHKQDDPRKAQRAAAEKWYVASAATDAEKMARMTDLLSRMQQRSPKAIKAHNLWLDGLYDANKVEIEKM